MADPKKEIVYVCTANTCRSPMAEGLLRHALRGESGALAGLVVSSAGVAASDGQPANPNSIKAMQKVGIDISSHRSAPLTQAISDRALAVVAMTQSHLDVLSHRLNPPPGYAFLMRQFVEDAGSMEIPDPYGMDLLAYEACRDSMVEALPSLLASLGKLYQLELDPDAEVDGSGTKESQ